MLWVNIKVVLKVMVADVTFVKEAGEGQGWSASGQGLERNLCVGKKPVKHWGW